MKKEETEAYNTVNDHKKRFHHKSLIRLINPSKSDIGKISRKLLDKMNKTLIPNNNIKKQKNTTTVTDCFKNVPTKNSAASFSSIWKTFTI